MFFERNYSLNALCQLSGRVHFKITGWVTGLQMSLHLYSAHSCTLSVKWKSPFRNHSLRGTGFQCHYTFTQPIQEIFLHTEDNDRLQCILYCCIYWCNILCSIAFLEMVSISGNGFSICFFSEAFGNCCDLSSTTRLLSRSYMRNISSCQTRHLTRMRLP